MRPLRGHPASLARMTRQCTLFLAIALSLGAGKAGVSLSERPRPTSAHERYIDGLERAGLGNSALARDWIAAARSSIHQPIAVTLPFREAGYFAASEARAVGYAVRLKDGQRLVATAEVAGTPITLFLDLFEQTADTPNPLNLVARLDTAASTGAQLAYEARRDGNYVLRVQPEL